MRPDDRTPEKVVQKPPSLTTTTSTTTTTAATSPPTTTTTTSQSNVEDAIDDVDMKPQTTKGGNPNVPKDRKYGQYVASGRE